MYCKPKFKLHNCVFLNGLEKGRKRFHIDSMKVWEPVHVDSMQNWEPNDKPVVSGSFWKGVFWGILLSAMIAAMGFLLVAWIASYVWI